MDILNCIEVGSITGFFGVKGGVKIFSLTRPRDNIKSYTNFLCDKNGKVQQIKLTGIKKSGKNIVSNIENVNSREDAQQYIGGKLYIKPDELPKLENEYYWRDLIGLSVFDQNKNELGIVNSLVETGVNDVLIIKNEEEETLIPFIMDKYINSVDLESKILIVNWNDW